MLSTTSPRRHDCGCEATDDILPKVVAFFRGRGPRGRVIQHCGPKRACEMAITALHCGPDALITHEFFEAIFVALIRIRLREDEEGYEGGDEYGGGHDGSVLLPLDEEDEDLDASATSTASSRSWDWDNIWYEFAKAFELRWNTVNVAQLLRNLSELDLVRGEEWWVAVLQNRGAEALLNYEGYIAAGLTEEPAASVLSAMRRDAKFIQSIDDLFDLYVDIDARVHGHV
ncbi:hypothetical protein NPX13_g6441 [Xylaria arbuscula]|uniref:Uncharacterized protein n=1 Tax=Xylaria arbuscula TaxID=114810 RepID=A0A9W8NCJ4_9PEZI|nr:hypothetical protein NPX13_g6441 [Xylaria arbuscula]